MSKNIFKGQDEQQSFTTNENYREFLRENLSESSNSNSNSNNSKINIKFTSLFIIILGTIVITGFSLSVFIAEEIKNTAITLEKDLYSIWVLSEARNHLSPQVFSNENLDEKEEMFLHFYDILHNPDIVRIKVWNNDGTILYSDDKSIVGENFRDNLRFQEAMNGESVVEIKAPVDPENISELGYGQLMEVYVPITYDDENIVGVIELYSSLDTINEAVSETDGVIFNVLGFSLIAIIGILGYMFFVTKKNIFEPINAIKIASEKVSRGNLEVEIPIKGNKNDEIVNLQKSFNAMVKSINLNIELQKELDESRHNLAVKDEQLRNQKLTTIGELGARLAHDLRNPLSLIKNNMLVIKKTSSDPKFNGRIEVQRINDAISRMSHQIENVLDFVKDRELTLSNANLKTIIKSAAGDKTKLIKFDFPKNDVSVKCDPLLLEMVFINIINNAVHAIENSGQIIIRIIDNPQETIIEIEDSGPGIPKDVLPKIFEPLFTTKLEGTGLGLSSCKNIIEKHKGTIIAKNNPTTFTITLPKNN